MSTTSPATPDPTPPQTPSGRLISLVHRLIDYGTQLAASFRQRNTDTAPDAAVGFGTSSISVILARIALALHRARLLEQRIVRTAPRLDAPAPIPPQPPRASPILAPKTPRISQPRPPLAQLPTVEQIALKLRRQPIGRVFADICRDLGIRPSNPLWRDLQEAILRYGGNTARIIMEQLDRAFPIAHIAARFKRKRTAPPVLAGTGPPAAAAQAA